MPDFNDFYAFKMTTSKNSYSSKGGNNSRGDGDIGCGGALTLVAVILFIVWLIGKF